MLHSSGFSEPPSGCEMAIVHKMPTSQCNAVKTTAHLKELFAEHGIPQSIRSDNGPQLSSHLFNEFTEK